MTAPTLWPFQAAALDRLAASFAAGRRSPLLVAPTGSGKTVMAAELIRREREAGHRCLFLAPRRELVDQTTHKLAALGVGHGVILAGDRRTNLYAPVQVASVDTLLSRMVRRSRLTLPPFELVIVDEAHLGVTRARAALLAQWPDARRVGMTATPARRDGRALGIFYDDLIEAATPAALVASGHLVPARYFTVSTPDLSRVRVVAGEFNAKDLDHAVNRAELIGDVVQHWLGHAAERRSVVFATSVAHSVALAAQFRQHGVAAEHVDAGTPHGERADTFDRFRCGATQVLTNCFLASYGFDLPALDCIVLARPTRSTALYLQMLGRGLRTAAEKADCLVLDHAGNVHRHGFATDDRLWTLDGERALAEPAAAVRGLRDGGKILTCPDCKCSFTGSRECPECGYYFAPKGRMVHTLDGELVEVGAHLDGDQQGRLTFYLELRGVASERGYRGGWCAHKYRERHGAFPPWTWNELPAATPTIETRRWLTSRVIAWRRAREATSA